MARADSQVYSLGTLLAALAAPTQNAPSTATTGGTLAAATYYYKVSALNAAGETLPSGEQSQVTTGSTSTVTVNWAAVPGATSYRVYRGTAAGAENVYFTAGAGATSFVDTGAAGTAGTPAAANTTGSGLGVSVRGGEYMFLAEGTVGGATVSLQIQNPNGNWTDVGALAGNAIVKSTTLPFVVTPVVLPASVVRVASTGGASSGLNAWLAGIG